MLDQLPFDIIENIAKINYEVACLLMCVLPNFYRSLQNVNYYNYIFKRFDERVKHDLDYIEYYFVNGKRGRSEKDPKTGLRLPSYNDHNFKIYKWYKKGKLHRTEKQDNLTLPAIIYRDKCMIWYVNGKKYRNDRDNNTQLLLPTMTIENITKKWFINDQLHRTERDPVTGYTLPATFIYRSDTDYTIIWAKDGKFHMEDKDKDNDKMLPAFISGRYIQYYVNGEFMQITMNENSIEMINKIKNMYSVFKFSN